MRNWMEFNRKPNQFKIGCLFFLSRLWRTPASTENQNSELDMRMAQNLNFSKLQKRHLAGAQSSDLPIDSSGFRKKVFRPVNELNWYKWRFKRMKNQRSPKWILTICLWCRSGRYSAICLCRIKSDQEPYSPIIPPDPNLNWPIDLESVRKVFEELKFPSSNLRMPTRT